MYLAILKEDGSVVPYIDIQGYKSYIPDYIKDIQSISSGYNCYVMRSNNGSIYCFGENAFTFPFNTFETIKPTSIPINSPTMTPTLAPTKIPLPTANIEKLRAIYEDNSILITGKISLGKAKIIPIIVKDSDGKVVLAFKCISGEDGILNYKFYFPLYKYSAYLVEIACKEYIIGDFSVDTTGDVFINETSTILNYYKFGDVSGDDKVDSADYLLMRMYLLGKRDDLPYSKWQITGDLNQDGIIDTGDYQRLRRYLLRIIDKLPVAN